MFPSRQMLRLNLEMDQDDWETIQYDETFDIEVEAMFWMDGEDPIFGQRPPQGCGAHARASARRCVSVTSMPTTRSM